MNGVLAGQLTDTPEASHSREFLRFLTLRFRFGNRFAAGSADLALREAKRLGYTLRFVICRFAGK